jgi:predicted ATPase/DNA-binding XRE family transcriptional regulator
MKSGASVPFGAQLKALRESAGFTQEELATIAGLSVHAVSALERGERRRPHVETVRALSAALDLNGAARDALLASARAPAQDAAADGLGGAALPLPLTALFGREGDVRALRAALADPAARLITLVGPGGVGKTRLAQELARAIAEEGSTRVVFVPLAAIREPVFVASAVAEALGLADVTAVDLARRARAACNGRPTLLVLDNFEQVLDAASLVADLLTAVAALRFVVTSRAPLHLRGEREHAVGPLGLDADPSGTAFADLARAPAIRLFVERVRNVRPDFRLSAANGSAVTAICRRLDTLPLALELAARWIKVLTIDDLLHRLEHDVLLSTAGPRDLPERQQTMNATVGWSYQLLDGGEQRAFRRFGALPGRFPIEAAEAVLAGDRIASGGNDAALQAVAGLIDRSLLLRAEGHDTPTRPLYSMLETVRAFAALELQAAGERDDAMDGLARYCLGEASRAGEGLIGREQSFWLNRVREDLESYRGALKWLLDRGRAADAAAIAWSLMFFWLIRGHAAEAVRWYEQVLNLPSLPPAAEAKALVGAAAMWYTQGELSRARTALTRALRVATDASDTVMAIHAELVFAHVEHAGGNSAAARERFLRSIEGFRTLGIPWGHGNALSGLAGVALATGDASTAEALLDEAVPVLHAAGPWFRSLALYVRAVLALRRGQPDAALLHVRGSLTDIQDLHDKFAFVNSLVPLAVAAVSKGDDMWAARILGARDDVTERTGATVVDKSVDDLRDQAEREVRARLGPDRWNRAYAAGRVTSIDSLIKEIDRVLKRPGPRIASVDRASNG